MTRPLRIRHRRMFTVLAVVLPLAFGFGIAVRKPVPLMKALPAELREATSPVRTELWARHDLFPNVPVSVRLLQEGGRFAVACAASENFVKPDLLAYWAADVPPGTDKLPHDAILLGAFTATALPLPAEATNRPGVLILFSLADQEVVAVAQPALFNVSTL